MNRVPNSGILGDMSNPSVQISRAKEQLTAPHMPESLFMREFIACAERALSAEGLQMLREFSGPRGFAVMTGARSYLRIHAFDRNGLMLASGHAQLLKEVPGTHGGTGGRCVRDARGVYFSAQNYRENQICYDRSERDLLPSSPFARILVCVERSSQQGSTHTEVDLSSGNVRRYCSGYSRLEWSLSDSQRDDLSELTGRRGVEWLLRLWRELEIHTSSISPPMSHFC